MSNKISSNGISPDNMQDLGVAPDVRIDIAPVAKTASQVGVLNKISSGASSMARWCFSSGVNFQKGL